MTSPAHRVAGRPLPEDFERIFQEHHELVFRVAYRITGSTEDAEDVLQTLFLRLLRREMLPDLERNPKAYLHRAAVNIGLDIVRQRGRHVRSEDLEEQLEDKRPRQDRQHHGTQIQDLLRDALSELTPRDAEIFVLRYVEGYDNAEIARILGTSRGTVAVLLFRSRSRLKKSMKKRLGENI